MTEAPTPRVEVKEIGEDPLKALQKEFATSIDSDATRLGLSEWVRQPRVLIPAAGVATGLAAFIPGFVEALAQGKPAIEAVKYTLASTPISTIWEAVATKGNAAELVEKYMLAARATIVPAITGAAMVGGFLGGFEWAKRTREAISLGLAPIRRKSTQMFALLGEDSYVGDVFWQTQPSRVIPIVEDARAMRRVLTGKEQRGTFLTVANGEYGNESPLGPWRQLKLDGRWLLPTKQGKYLVLLGMGETKDEELPLTEEPLVDLTVEELAIAADRIYSLARQHGVKPDRVVRIYLGNPERKRLRGTGSGIRSVTEKEVAAGTVDIFVDVGQTIMAALKEKVGGASVSFETGVAEYWQGLRRVVGKEITIHDESNPDPGDAVILVYERHTDESVQSTKQSKQQNPGRRVVVLTSSLESHRKALKAGLESLCVAKILARKLLDIQTRLVNETPESIQESL